MPDFVYIDYRQQTQEMLQVQNGRLVLEQSQDYNLCLQDIQDGGSSRCELIFEPFAEVATIYRYSDGENQTISLEELQDIQITESDTHPTQNTSFAGARCDGPEFYPIETGGYSQNTCYLSIRKGSWQTKNVTINTYPTISNESRRFGNPHNIFWIID